MFAGINMNRLVGGGKAAGAGGAGTSKRKAEVSPRKMEPAIKKRSALGDLTNAVKKKGGLGGGNKDKAEKPLVDMKQDVFIPKVITRSKSKSLVNLVLPDEPIEVKKEAKKPEKQELNAIVVKAEKEKEKEAPSKLPLRKTRSSASHSRTSKSSENENEGKEKEAEQEMKPPAPLASFFQRMATRRSAATIAPVEEDTEEDEDDSRYLSAVSSPESDSEDAIEIETQNRKNEEVSRNQKLKLPDGVIDFDAETGNDPYQVGLYAEDIFAYYRRRESKFQAKKYLDMQGELNKNMRSILIDWMVEVQESFELNHETMYLGIKLVDLFLSQVQVKREKLQLVGTTALYISAKYDERSPPVIDDFCYICDDAYSQKAVIQMEKKLLKTVDYDIGAPLSYRFLRRYSRCARLDMETLTLARFILEMSLMEYDFIDVRDSMMAASSLLLALVMKGVKNPWSKTLEHFSGYTKNDIFDLTHRLHAYISNPPVHLKTIRSKYSHKVFYESAKVPIPDVLNI